MPDPGQLYGERIGRLKTAIALQKPDRTPVISWSDAFCANHMGVPMSKFSLDSFFANEVTAQSFARLPGFDACEMSQVTLDFLGALFFSRVKVAGRDLPEGSAWNIDEAERLTVEDYDKLAQRGWNNFWIPWCMENLGFNLPEYFPVLGAVVGDAYQKLGAIGMPIYTAAIGAATPFEPLSGGRSMAKFINDLFRMPDRVQAAMDAMMPEYVGMMKGMLSGPQKPFSVFIGCARGTPQFLSPKLFDRFVWPYLKTTIETVIECGVIANLHFDTDWGRVLDYFKDFPKGTCVFASDHATDMHKVYDVLGRTMAIKGDVPSPMLAFGTPDDVYKYSRDLIEYVGDGLILAPACTMPGNAKVENIEAMFAAAAG